MLKKEGIIEKNEMLSVKPQDYLSKGFLTSDGQVREGINGEYSLAMAYRLKEEGLTPDQTSKVIEKLYEIAAKESQQDPDSKLSASTIEAFQKFVKSPEVSKSKTITEVFEASKPWIVDWKNLSAIIVHLERMQSQLALLIEIPKIKR
jgi:hypothetical protein